MAGDLMKIPLPLLWHSKNPQISKRKIELVSEASLKKGTVEKSWEDLTNDEKKALMKAYYFKEELKSITVKDLNKFKFHERSSEEDIVEEILKK